MFRKKRHGPKKTTKYIATKMREAALVSANVSV